MTTHESDAGQRLRYPGMTWLELVLHGLLSLLFKRRDIALDGELYLRRWYLRGRGTDSQWFLHHIRRADADRELHDHPWCFATRVLTGGYVEERPSGSLRATQWLTRFAFPSTHAHRIHYVSPGTFTLVHAGPAERTWGFWVRNRERRARWRPWREFLGTPDAPDWPEDVVRH